MDGRVSTLRPNYGDARSGPTPSPIITVVVLVTGVAGGLILVIAVILFCKYCIKRKKGLKRQPALFRRRESGNNNGGRSYKQYSHYESVHCEKSQSPESRRDSLTKSALKSHRSSACSTNDEESSIDMAVARYKESIKDEIETDGGETSRSRRDSDGAVTAPGGSSEGGEARHHRRVSLLLHGLQHYPNSSVPGVPGTYSKARYQRRHTEGEYLQLKSSQRSERPPKVRRQSSGSTPSREHSLKSRFDGPPGARIEEPHSSNTTTVERFAEVAPSRALMTQESPSPPQSSKPHRTEVAAEVHRDPSSGSGGSKGDLTSSRTNSPPKCHPSSAHCSSAHSAGPHPSTSHASVSRSGSSTASTSHNSPRMSFSRASLRSSSRTAAALVASHRSTSFSGPTYSGSPRLSYSAAGRGSPRFSRSLSISTQGSPAGPYRSNSMSTQSSHPGPFRSHSISGQGSQPGTSRSHSISGQGSLPGTSRSLSISTPGTQPGPSRSHSISGPGSQPGPSRSHTISAQGNQLSPSRSPHCPRPDQGRCRPHAHSLETEYPRTESPRPGTSRRVRSCDDAGYDRDDYDRLEITQFHPGPVYSADHGMLHSGEDAPGELRSKVRYNDMGSLEEVSTVPMVQPVQVVAAPDLHIESSDDTETLNGAHKYRELWNLRATLEDEEDFSDTIRMEDMLSPDESEQQSEPATTSVNTSFESNTESTGPPERRRLPHRDDHLVKTASANLLHPNYENRRHAYRSLLTRKIKRPNAANAGSTDNSFDSMDTMDTDGNQSDSSRPEVTTTSFESTTTNTTDSTGEMQPNRLQQMRGDSGYKSLEAQNTLPGTPPRGHKKSIHFALEPEVGDSPTALTPSPDESPARQVPGASAASPQKPEPRGHHEFERNRAKTASKKRRDFGRERQIVQVYESVCEGETDSRSDQLSGDSFEESNPPGKLSMFSKIFKSHSRERKPTSFNRDWSVDEKTNNLFQEFSRYDPKLDPKSKYAVRPPGFRSRHRLNRKHAESLEYDSRRRDKLRPDMRSMSLGSDSSTSSLRRISPQDSIEEEETVEPTPVPNPKPTRRASWDGHGTRNVINLPRRTSMAPTLRDIPIIKLPTEDESPSPV